jgi:hypothetical protein
MSTIKWLGEFLFIPIGTERRSRILASAILLLIFIGGAVHWVYFFHQGKMTFQANDWPKEYSYYSALQQAVIEGRLPFHIDHPFQNTYRFLANPEIVLSPQIILLRWLDVGQFVLANTLIMYTLFFLGCLLLMRRFRLPLFAFLTLFTLAGFNGYITSHLAAGHSMWNGYFLLPLFGLTLLDMISLEPSRGVIFKVALVLFGIFLQGSFHMLVWCWIFLAFLAVGSWRLIKPVVSVIVLSVLLSAFRLIPAVLTYNQFSFPYISGYPDVRVLWEALTVIRQIDYTHLGGFSGTLAWYEYDAYIGLAGAAFILVFGLVYRIIKGEEWDDLRFPSLDIPIIMLIFLSINYSFAVIARLNLPLLAGERVASRFIAIPLVILLILATLRFGRFLPNIKRSNGARVLLGVIYLDLLSSIMIHNYNWRISRIENYYPKVLTGGVYHIISMPDPEYLISFWVGLGITIATLVGILLFFLPHWRHAKPVSTLG